MTPAERKRAQLAAALERSKIAHLDFAYTPQCESILRLYTGPNDREQCVFAATVAMVCRTCSLASYCCSRCADGWQRNSKIQTCVRCGHRGLIAASWSWVQIDARS
ncbi:hypothetical protein [Frigoribacterium sp. PhB24]|uniref:hypothetical protein n=1 Tax=Frigoribacterium sp. PhB24 TaxID=2485204 RepID=UPI000F4685AC|nr:hypothetical protein [Frigoribacterium sp. PhB24]ROS52960.1 hypothetical protein EDF50_1437 [Frigoribacterium sp. PhB24]